MDIEVELEHILRRIPVSTMATLEALNSDEIQEGYRDGFDGELCGNNRSRSYWHGWRNGMMDTKRMESDWAGQMLAHEYVQSTKRPMWTTGTVSDDDSDYAAEREWPSCPTCSGIGSVNPLTAPSWFFCTGVTECPSCGGDGEEHG